MKVGAEPKKLGALGGLLLLAGYLLYTNVLSDTAAPAAPPSPVRPAAAIAPRQEAPPEVSGPAPRPEASGGGQTASQEFRPSLRRSRPGELRDLSSIDAGLRLDLLAKLQQDRAGGGGRSLFEFGSAPLPRTPEPKVVPKPMVQTVPAPPKPVEAKPQPPPIPLKFFGYSVAYRQGVRRAFFLDGDEILIGVEGDVLKKRYRVVRIGVNSVVMEDLHFKQQQTLPLEPQVG